VAVFGQSGAGLDLYHHAGIDIGGIVKTEFKSLDQAKASKR